MNEEDNLKLIIIIFPPHATEELYLYDPNGFMIKIRCNPN